jgi:hypothetical protein
MGRIRIALPSAAAGCGLPDRWRNAMDGSILLTSNLEPFQKWVLIIAAVLTIVYAVMRPMKKKRKDPLAEKKPVSLAGQREVEKQMTDLIVELEKMARQMTSQLDTRAAKLEILLRDADERIETLRSLAAAAPSNGGTRGLKLAGASVVVDDVEEIPDPRHNEIYELAQNGHSAHQIAQRLGRPYGEVELILALRGHELGERHLAVR